MVRGCARAPVACSGIWVLAGFVARVVALMRSEGVRRLPVVNASGALVGLIAADDVLDLLAEEMSGLAGMLNRGIRREREERLVERMA